MEAQKKKRPTRWPWLAGLALVAVLGVFGVASIARTSTSNESASRRPVFKVRRGPLTISVVESGTIQAKERKIIKNEVEGQSTIIYLIPEGRLVEEGDLLVELEASRLEDDLVEQQIRVQNAEAAFVEHENLEVVKNQSVSDISKAELDYEFARQDLSKYVDGEYPNQLKETESRITLAKEELERAAEKLEWSQRLFEEKFISQTELDADRLTNNRAKLDYELAVESKQLLAKYTHKREMAQLESDIEQAKMALERVRLRTGADVVQAQADLKAKEAEFGQQKSKLAKVERQIANTKIYAPRAGLVVYATSARASWRGNDEPLDEGQSVRERQELIYLPTADEMIAELQIHESNLNKVQIGMPVRVTVDALKGRHFTGRVARVAPLPNAYQMRMNPDLKVYVTEVQLDGKNRDLRTGMSCQAEIIVDRYEDAVYAPVQAVVRENTQHVAYVQNGDDIEPTNVEIGLDNNRMVHVLKGLSAGQKVLLAPPLAAGTSPLSEDRSPDAAATKASGISTDAPATSERAGPTGKTAAPESSAPSAGPGNRSQRESRPGDMQRREASRDMSPEQRKRMRERFQNMTPEEREAMRQRYQRSGGRREGRSGGESGNRQRQRDP